MIYYQVKDGKIVSGPHGADSTYVKKLTSCGNPELLNLTTYELLPERREPLGEYQRAGSPVVMTDHVLIPAVDFTQDEIEAAKGAIIADNIAQLWQAATDYERSYISGSAVGLVTIGIVKQKPKSLAVMAWINSIWGGRYYPIKAALQAGKAFDSEMLDYSSCGPMPHTVPELMEEVLS
jgi:hypothetical protein